MPIPRPTACRLSGPSENLMVSANYPVLFWHAPLELPLLRRHTSCLIAKFQSCLIAWGYVCSRDDSVSDDSFEKGFLVRICFFGQSSRRHSHGLSKFVSVGALIHQQRPLREKKDLTLLTGPLLAKVEKSHCFWACVWSCISHYETHPQDARPRTSPPHNYWYFQAGRVVGYMGYV